jgi:hypothetical protein
MLLDDTRIRSKKHVYPNKRKTRITLFIIDEIHIQIDSTEDWS